MKSLHLPGLPRIVQHGFEILLNRGVGLENMTEQAIKEIYGIVDDLGTPAWRVCTFEKDIFLSWWPVEKAAAYELRTDPLFGVNDEHLLIRDNVLSHTVREVKERTNTFYLKSLDRSGKYCKEIATRVLVNNPPFKPPAPLVTAFFTLLKINILPPHEDDIISFNLYITPCDDNGTPIDETILLPALPYGEHLFPAEPGSYFLIQTAACDLLGEGPKSDPVLAQTKYISPVDIPEGILDQSKLSEDLSSKIDTVDEHAAQIQLLGSEITLKVQRDQGGKMIVTGIGLAAGEEEGEVAVVADRFRVFPSATEDGEGQAVFVIDTLTRKVYLAADMIADGTITARMLNTLELKAAIASINEAFIDSAQILNLQANKIMVGDSSAPIPLAIAPTDTLFRFDGSLLSTQGLKPLGME